MNVKQMLIPSVLTTILFVALFAANAAEPAYKAGWTQKQFIVTFWCPPPPTDQALAAVAAEPVYRLLGKQGLGLGPDQWPPPGVPVLHDIGYYMHAGGHGTIPSDWDQFLRFMEMHLKPGR